MIQDRRIRTSLVAIFADIVLTAIKFILAIFTGSAALLADAYHSATDFIVSLILLGGIVIRQRQEHKRNEQGIKLARRLESILAILVALIILYVPVEILQQVRESEGHQIENVWLGIFGMLLVIAIVFFMARLKTYVGKETDSIALEADGYHSMVDLFSSFAVLVSLIGFMMGIYLDNIVALLIAVMIAVSGLELLLSGFKSLIKGTDFDQLSLVDMLVELSKKMPVGINMLSNTKAVFAWFVAFRYRILLTIVGVYTGSGLQQIPYGFVGIKQYFSQSLGEPLQPGLHFIAPWPIGKISLIATDQVNAVSVGSSVHLNTDVKHAIWREIKQSRVSTEDIPYMVTGDENLIDINFTLHYRLNQPEIANQRSKNIEQLVSAYTESALWKSTGQRPFAQIMQTSHSQFANQIALNVRDELRSIGIEIGVVDAQLQSIQPPAMVVDSYRDVLTAVQEKEQRVNRAIAQRLSDLPGARAEVNTQATLIKADSLEKVLKVKGDTARMGQLASVYQGDEQAFKFEYYMNSLSKSLTNKQLIIADRDISSNDIRDWLNNNRQNRK